MELAQPKASGKSAAKYARVELAPRPFPKAAKPRPGKA
jgi:hypothetical protein